MISIRGIFQDGKITMICPSSQTIPENSEVLVTFIEDSEGDISDFIEDEQEELIEIEDDFEDDESEADNSDFESMREFKRVKARGHINIIDQSRKFRFQLNKSCLISLSNRHNIQFSAFVLIPLDSKPSLGYQ